MERRIKNVNNKTGTNTNSDAKVAIKGVVTEKKLRKSDTFKEMRRRISSSFGKLNMLKDDSTSIRTNNKSKSSTFEFATCSTANQKRCYSSTEIHEVNGMNHAMSSTSEPMQTHTPTKSSISSITDLWKRSSSSSSSSSIVKRHKSLSNVNTLPNQSSSSSIITHTNMSFKSSKPKHHSSSSTATSNTCQKQGPAAKISAKIRSRRGTNNSSSNFTKSSSSTVQQQIKSDSMRPHSVTRETIYSTALACDEQAFRMAMSNQNNQLQSNDPMTSSLTISRPRSDGHCFENALTNSINVHQQHPKVPRSGNRRLASMTDSNGPDSPGRLLVNTSHLFGRTDSYQKLDMLGEGSYATVFKGFSNLTRQTVALKEIRINPEEGVPFTAIREASLLKNLRHANIVILHDIVHAKETLTFVFEFVHSDLSKYIERHQKQNALSAGGGGGGSGGGIRSQNVQLFLWQLLRGLDFCHAKHVLHRDLKPQNLLISEMGELKLADFGLARAKSVPSRTYSNEVVTLWYRPPDVLLGSTDYNAALDMWGVGCIFIEMIGGSAIFPGLKDTDDQLDKIFKIMGSPNEKVWPAVSSLPNYAVFSTSHASYKGRPLHRVVPKLYSIPHAESLALAFLQIRPELRVLSRAAMSHPYFDDMPRRLLHSLPDNASIFSVPGIRLAPESPPQFNSYSNRQPLHHQINNNNLNSNIVNNNHNYRQHSNTFDLSEVFTANSQFKSTNNKQDWRAGDGFFNTTVQ